MINRIKIIDEIKENLSQKEYLKADKLIDILLSLNPLDDMALTLKVYTIKNKNIAILLLNQALKINPENQKAKQLLNKINIKRTLDNGTYKETSLKTSGFDNPNFLYTYNLGQFMQANEIICDKNYPTDEYLQFLYHFIDVEFSFNQKIESLLIKMSLPRQNRICTIRFFSYKIDDLLSYPEGKMPTYIGMAQMKLHYQYGPSIHVFRKRF